MTTPPTPTLAPYAILSDPDPVILAVNAAVAQAIVEPARRGAIKGLLAHLLWWALPLEREDTRRSRLLSSYDERVDAILEAVAEVG